MVAVTLALAFAAAFVPPAAMPASRVLVTPGASVSMFSGGSKSTPKAAPKPKAKAGVRKGPASPTKPKVTAKAKPLSPGSNYPTTKNIQVQASGFGNFLQKFQLAGGKSKYGVPIYLPNGNINPAYLAAERKELVAQKKKNVAAEAAKTKKMKAAGTFELATVIEKKIGNVGSGKEYYQSGR